MSLCYTSLCHIKKKERNYIILVLIDTINKLIIKEDEIPILNILKTYIYI